MILPSTPNPFGEAFVKDPFLPPPADVGNLQKTSFERWKQLTIQVRQTGTTTSLIICGEAGSGKTHLLARFRQWIVSTEQPEVLIWAKQATVSQLWRELRRSLFRDLLRTRPNGTTDLDRVIDNCFPGWRSKSMREGIVTLITGPKRPSDVLANLLKEYSQGCQLDRATRTVLPSLFDRDKADQAKDWLRGEDLEPEALMALGLPPKSLTDAEREAHSKEVVKALCRLAGRKTVLCFCFDQVEGLQQGTSDAASLYEFAKMVFELVEEPHAAVLAVTLIQPHILQTLEATAHRAYIDRLKQHVANIPSLTWEQTVAVTLARLEGIPAVRAERQLLNDTYWPMGEGFLRKVHEDNTFSLTPRQLLKMCEKEFQRLQVGAGESDEGGVAEGSKHVAVGSGKPPVPAQTTPPVTDEIHNGWVHARKNFLTKPQSIQFDRVIELGLPWLAELAHTEWTPTKVAAALGDVNLVIQPAATSRKAVAISCCHQDPRSLWRRLDRLLTQWTETKAKYLDLMVVLRPSVPPPSEAAAKRLSELRKAGVRVLELDERPLAELAAYQYMLTAAHNGKLLRTGKSVSAVEYSDWAKEHLSPLVSGFFHSIVQPTDGLPVAAPASTLPTNKPAAKTTRAKK